MKECCVRCTYGVYVPRFTVPTLVAADMEAGAVSWTARVVGAVGAVGAKAAAAANGASSRRLVVVAAAAAGANGRRRAVRQLCVRRAAW